MVPHQANLRIIEAVAQARAGADGAGVREHPALRQHVGGHRRRSRCVRRLRKGACSPGSLLLLPGFGGGLSYSAQVVRWGERTQPLHTSAAQLPANDRTALEIIAECQRRKTTPGDPAAADPFAGL